MEELYTFNSHQLQLIKNCSFQHKLASDRKKILSCNKSAKVSPKSLFIPQVQKQNQKVSFRRKSYRKVLFMLPLEKVVQKKLVTKNQGRIHERNSLVLQKSREDSGVYPQTEKNERGGGYHIRAIRTQAKRAFSAVQRPQVQQKIIPLNEVKEIQNENVQRKQKKSTSMKLSPKINFPISNRKLPPAFKSKLGDKYLQKILENERKQLSPKIPQFCQKEISFNQDRQAFSQEIEKFKRRLMGESKLLQKLSMPF